jgi:SAM-dependent methyltransferase
MNCRSAFRSCPVCSSGIVECLHHQRFVLPAGHPLADGYDIVSCVACGFVYADVAASQADYDRFYAHFSKYDDQAHSTGSGGSAVDRERLDETAAILSGYVPSTKRILDFGCAGGGLLTALKQRGYAHLVGVDPSPASVRAALAAAGEAYQGWLTNFPREAGKFDCVVLSHVLEHVLELAPALAALPSLLRDDALVFAEVPDAARYADYVFAPFQDFNTEHINHFSALCLDNAMARHGFARMGGGERLLRSSTHTFTPSVYGVYQSTPFAHPLRPEQNLRTPIARYIVRSSGLLAQIDATISFALERSPELIVWGAGQLTLKLLAETRLGKANVIAFVDSNPVHHGQCLCGVPILAPEQARSLPQPILISTLLHQNEIREQIQSMGFPNLVINLAEGGSAFGAGAV